MSVAVPIALIQEINRGIGITKFAPGDRFYRSLVDATLPTAYTYAGPGSTTGTAEMAISERNFLIKVYVDPVIDGKYDDPYIKAHKLLDEYLETWFGLINEAEESLLDDGVNSGYRVQIDEGKLVADTGVSQKMEWLPGQLYIGFQITLPIIIHWGTGLF